ncbi:MAG: hypothetical protein K0U29_09085 [Gammaproteobacteria bacterium]|nr:hypothetical protein [Gammaproteobacteria bacterium]MCH9745068.1 hypothetical protein [Gammaproteobacteria bacterium]
MKKKKSLLERYAREWVSEPWIFSMMMLGIITAHKLMNPEETFEDAVNSQASGWIGATTLFALSPITQHLLGKLYDRWEKPNTDLNYSTCRAIGNNWKRYTLKYQPALAIFTLANSASMKWLLHTKSLKTGGTVSFTEALAENAPLAIGAGVFLFAVYPFLNVATEALTKSVHNSNCLKHKSGDSRATKFARDFGKSYAAVNINFMPAMSSVLTLTGLAGHFIFDAPAEDMWHNLAPILFGAGAMKLSGALPLAMMATEAAKTYVSRRFFGREEEAEEPLLPFAAGDAPAINATASTPTQ